MIQSVSLLSICGLLLWVSMACTPKHTESVVLSERGYRVSLDVSDTRIWLGPDIAPFPSFAELVVRVHDAQGQPVNGIPVRFAVEPSWAQYASLTPAETLTRNGEARATFQASSIGVVRVMAQVDNVTRDVAMTVESRPSPVGGGA